MRGVSASIATWREMVPLFATIRKGRGTVNANQMKHAARLEDWKQRIMECRSSGLPVKTWCAQNECNTSTYYRWERELFGRIRKPACEATELVVRSESMPVGAKQELVEVPVAEEAISATAGSTFRPVAIVRTDRLELSLTNGVSPKLMRQLKELLLYAE